MWGVLGALLICCLAALPAGEAYPKCLLSGDETKTIPYDELSAMGDKLMKRADNHKQVISAVKNTNATAENRHLYMFLVRPYLKSTKGNSTNKKPSFWFEGGLTGNDFNSVMMLLDLACELADKCKGENCNYNYYIVPMVNPDGYEYARLTNSSWMKNRQANSGSKCIGTNLNRNFPPNASFTTHGTADPCSPYNRGPTPSSAMEVAALKTMKDCASDHSYAFSVTVLPTMKNESLLWPLANNSTLIPENEDYKKIAKYFDKTGATEMGPYSEKYLTSGTSMDYSYYMSPKDTYSFTLKLEKKKLVTRALTNDKVISGITQLIEHVGAKSNKTTTPKPTTKPTPKPASKPTTNSTTKPTTATPTTPIPNCKDSGKYEKSLEIDLKNATALDFKTLKTGSCPSYASISYYIKKLAAKSVKIELVSLPLKNSAGSLQMVIVKPYMRKNAKNAKHIPDRKSYWLEGGLVANSCDSVTSLIALIKILAYETPKEHMKSIFYIVPLMNPQGYEYSRIMNKKWVKNRQMIDGYKCRGVSLNHNYPPEKSFKFHSSACPCDDNYRGKYPGSTEEYKKLMILRQSTITPAVALSFIPSDEKITYFLFPFAYTNTTVPEYEKYKKIAKAARDATLKVGGNEAYYEYKSFSMWRLQSGTSMDYFYYKHSQSSGKTGKNKQYHYSISIAMGQYPGRYVMTVAKSIMPALVAVIAEAKKV